MGSALPDPVKDNAATSPIPQQAIENKPAPGQTGPKGMSPRTTYSRVNTGSPPVMDAGAMSQKSGPNLGLNSLPKLAAPRGCMTTIQERPSLQEMVKAAMAGTSQRLSVNLEAARQAEQHQGVKTASVASAPVSLRGHVPTELVQKLAGALGFMEDQLRKEAELAPGEGPGALQVMEAESSEKNIDAGQGGQATSQNQPPQNPPLQAEKAQQGNAGTGLATNDEMKHPEQPVEPIKNASAQALKLVEGNLNRLAKLGFAITQKGHDFDSKLYEMKARHAAERMALGEEFGAQRFGGPTPPEGSGGALERLVNIARFGSSEAMEGDPRHLEYAAKQHAQGSNAWNPLGGSMTPSSHEQGGTEMMYGRYKKPGAAAPAKEASAKTAAPALPAAGLKTAPGRVATAMGQAARKIRHSAGRGAEATKDFAKKHKGEIAAGAGGAAVGGAAGFAAGKKKESSGVAALVRSIVKQAEDAINPAQISSPGNVDPAQPPPGASASGEDVPAEPGDVTSQKRLIQSNEAAINYTKQQAKADPKKDVAQVLAEPPLSSSTDKVLNLAFDSTGQAGVKISSAQPTAAGLRKTASQLGATRVLLGRLLKEAGASTGASAAANGQ